jgi:hypothetical protein
MAVWGFLKEHDGVIALAITVLTIAYSAYQYFSIKRAEERNRRFTTYHELIKNLVERENQQVPMKLDRQLAVVFELRNFPEYAEPTIRILEGVRAEWATLYGPENKNRRLIGKIESTLFYLRSRQREATWPDDS